MRACGPGILTCHGPVVFWSVNLDPSAGSCSPARPALTKRDSMTCWLPTSEPAVKTDVPGSSDA